MPPVAVHVLRGKDSPLANKPLTLLCTSNRRSDRGFAEDYVGRLYARVAEHLATHGIRTIVSYPLITEPPRPLAGSVAGVIQLDTSMSTFRSFRSLLRLIRAENVRVIYFSDRVVRSWKYALLRCAGVRRIVIHLHSAYGRPKPPKGLKWLAKYILGRTPFIVADAVIGVSDYVARRQIEVAQVPSNRVFRIWNGIALPTLKQIKDKSFFLPLGVPPDSMVIFCAVRAVPEKGITHLLRAFDLLMSRRTGQTTKLSLVYFGDGAQFGELRALRKSLASRDAIFMPGKRPDVQEAMGAADICVVPSLKEAFGLTALEAMASGRPAIATNVGGVPEMIEDGVTGLLVPPGDEEALSRALEQLLADPSAAASLGAAARRRVAERFTEEVQMRDLTRLVEAGFGTVCDSLHG